MKFRTRILIVILSLISISGGISTIINEFVFRNMIEEEIKSHLETAVELKAHHVETFLNEEKHLVLQISQRGFEELFTLDKSDKGYNNKLNKSIKMLKNTAVINEEIDDIFILDIDGVVITSNIEERIGLDRSDDPYFINGKKGVYVKDAYFSIFFENQPSLALSAPILKKANSTLLGVAVIRIKMDPLNQIMTQRASLGETGETYLINRDGYMITPSRFTEDTFLKQGVDTQNARSCFEDIRFWGTEEHKHEAVLCKNYLGEDILGVHAHVPEMEWCLLAEINKKEAFASVTRLTQIILMIFVLSLVVGIAVSIYISGIIARPIVKLHQGAEEITKGNLDYRVGIPAKDEIGQLSRAFDEMTINLKRSRAEVEEYQNVLEERIKERTKELAKANKDLKREVSQRKRTEKAIKKLAYYDSLTGLPNKVLFDDRLSLALLQAKRSGQKLAVMFLDLDHFKDVNDTLGHKVGDELLRDVGERLRGLLRKGDTVGRFGGDEFLLLLPGVVQAEDVSKLAQKILEAFRQPFVLGGHKLEMTTSIGAAIYPNDGKDADILIKNADIAMYCAKKSRNNYQHYTPDMDSKT